MSASWDHDLRPMTEEERRYHAHVNLSCGHGKCREMPAWLATYRYVTGRAGRVSTSRRPLCDSHAEAWRAKHPAPETPAP